MNKVEHFADINALAKAAADIIVSLSANASESHEKFSIALSGGNTPTALFQLLATEKYSSQINWKNVFVFWSDERCVSADSNDNNSHHARLDLLDHVPIRKENIFAVPVELLPAAAAEKYERTIKKFFNSESPRFDLVLLGMGANGHTASLFPHTTVLHETDALVKEVFVNELKMWRVTFTAALINAAKKIVFLVAGEDKAAMLKTVLDGDYDPDNYPAQLIKNADWLVAP